MLMKMVLVCAGHGEGGSSAISRAKEWMLVARWSSAMARLAEEP